MTLATGSFRGAIAGSNADYNGHHVVVERGDFVHGSRLLSEEDKEARGWRAYYTWSGICYLARGTTFAEALAAGLREYDRGALGARVQVACVTEDHARACEAAGLLAWSEAAEAAVDAAWRTPLFDEVNWALRLELQVGIPAVRFLTTSSSVEEFEAKVKAFTEERRHARRPAQGLA